MRLADLEKYQGLIARREFLLEFLLRSANAPAFEVRVPYWLDQKKGISFGEIRAQVFVSEEDLIAAIKAPAEEAAKRQLRAIEEELVAAGVEFDAVPA